MTNPKNQKNNARPRGLFPTLLVLAGMIVIVVVVFFLKNQQSAPPEAVIESAEAQLDRYLAEKKPIFAFFHSNNCHSCIVMMDTVAEVYPDFQGEVALVDVDVYDLQNESLLRRAEIYSIPTLVFIGRNGEGKVAIGVIEAEALRDQLMILKDTP